MRKVSHKETNYIYLVYYYYHLYLLYFEDKVKEIFV